MQKINLKKYKIRALVGSIPLSGHFTPLVRIAHAMNESQEFQIVFATSEFAFQKINLPSEIKRFGLKDDTQIIAQQCKIDKMISAYYDEVWQQQIFSFIQEFKPDVIVCDFFAPSFVKMGKKFGIPTVIHSPSPLSTLMPFTDFPMISKSVSLFGFIINFNNIFKLTLPKQVKSLVEFGPQLINSFVMFSSFFGIQDACSLPPNFKMIGFTFPRDSPESKIQGDLKIWIEDKKKDNKDIIYVSVGSLLKMPQKFIDFLYEGLKKMDIAVIWSMKQGNIPEQNPNFLVRKWLPQWDILQMKEIKLMITHCGWGGITECIQGCKPMLCIPSFGDQTFNAKTIVQKGLGLILRQQKSLALGPQSLYQFRFTHEELEQKINLPRRNQSYTNRLEKLRSIMMAETGGCKQAVTIIRNAAYLGIDHLIDRNVEKLQKKSILPLFSFLLISIIIYLLWRIFTRDGPTQTL